MGRPLKLTETVEGTLKVGAIGNTSQTGNQIQVTAYLPPNTSTDWISGSGGTAARTSYLLNQKGSKRFTCVNATDGTGICKLVTTSPAAGEFRMFATDNSGKTYYVSKISGRKATLVQYGASGWEFADGASVAWNLTAAETGLSVIITGA
jgi:hypothetical protein